MSSEKNKGKQRKHSPLPWYCSPDKLHQDRVYDKDGMEVCKTSSPITLAVGGGLCEANMKHIVNSVNSYSTLKAENERLKEWKRQQLLVWGKVDDFVRPTTSLGNNVSDEALARLKQYDKLQSDNEKKDKRIALLESLLAECSSVLDGLKAQMSKHTGYNALPLIHKINNALTNE